MVVVVDDAAKHITAFHRTNCLGSVNRYRATLLQALVRSSPIVVLDVLYQHSPQMRFTQDY
jgi:hypothetical protein